MLISVSTLILHINLYYFILYPVGTSKMGPDTDPNAVVDSRLNVRGVKRLRQIDAGISKIIHDLFFENSKLIQLYFSYSQCQSL